MHPENSLSTFYRNLWLTLGVFVVFSITFAIYVRSEKQIDRANELRLYSYLLADELRQSSDDLTRMVRTYVVTGNPIYKQYYQEILDIRNGTRPRPIDYSAIYWNLVPTGEPRPSSSGRAYPLLELMRKAGFTEQEFAKLAQSKANSDALTRTEFAAMKLIESANPPTAADRLQAGRMLHDDAYYQAKAAIMRPLGEFHRMMDKRTLDAVHAAEIHATILRMMFIFLGLLMSFLLWRTYKSLSATLGGSVSELYMRIARIGSGDFSSAIPVAKGMENSVLGWLSETQINLARLNAKRRDAEVKNQRMTQLYAALSQCNQAIVRCGNAEELFPQICRDAVIFGRMKMAWIGLLDEQSRQIRPVASFGAGAEYLEELHMTADTGYAFGRDPSGVAFCENRPVWCQDFQHDPSTAPWHESGAAQGWQASAALPLHRNGVVIGTFNLYAGESNAFDETERDLLVEMAMDIDYALERFTIEAEREHFKKELQESEESSRLVLENSLDAVININNVGIVIEWSGAAAGMFGYQRTEAIGKVLAELIIPEAHRNAHHQGIQRLLATNKPRMIGKRVEVNALRRDGREFPVEMTLAQIRRGSQIFFSAFIRDITDRKQTEAHIRRLAHFDALTELPNRTQLEDRAKYTISLAQRSQESLAVMFLDLDHFKDINDTLGHSIGDALLIEVAKRLRLILREEDTVSRLGGDEFIFLLPGADTLGATQIAQKLLDVIDQPYQIEHYDLTVTASIGIALYPTDGLDLETLSKRADTAMYRAKQENRNGYRFFTSEMQAHSLRHLQLQNALRHALDRDQLQIHYQPQISVKTGRIIGAEALLRWQHPEFGAVSPVEFIPVAEDSGLILPIGEWVLRQAVHQAKSWMEEGCDALVIAVNLSAVQFRHPDLPDLVTRILDDAGLPPEYLELELTEGVAMHDPQGAIAVMNNLHDRGIRMSIDDFGTGYSSLSYLKKFKVYKLKIDQSFVRDISTDPEDKAIVSAIINMARSLDLQTIAEGVETPGQLAFLHEQGCDEVQGYYYSKPLPPGQFESFARARNHKPVAQPDYPG